VDLVLQLVGGLLEHLLGLHLLLLKVVKIELQLVHLVVELLVARLVLQVLAVSLGQLSVQLVDRLLVDVEVVLDLLQERLYVGLQAVAHLVLQLLVLGLHLLVLVVGLLSSGQGLSDRILLHILRLLEHRLLDIVSLLAQGRLGVSDFEEVVPLELVLLDVHLHFSELLLHVGQAVAQSLLLLALLLEHLQVSLAVLHGVGDALVLLHAHLDGFLLEGERILVGLLSLGKHIAYLVGVVSIVLADGFDLAL